MTPEAKVKKVGRAIMTKMGMYHFPAFSGGYGRSGVPDDIGCYQGVFVAVEYKANGGKPTALQLKNMDDIRKSGGIALLIDEENVHQLEELINYEVQNSRKREAHSP
jgi:hypothetical protein